MRWLLLILLSVLCEDTQPPETVEIKILVTNIQTLKGSIELGIFNHPKTFLKKGEAYKTYSQKVTTDTMIFLLKGFKKDYYAISLFHDINSDNECNLNFLGIPIEPYGFSKNFKPKFSKPSFDHCKINVSQNIPILIRLID